MKDFSDETGLVWLPLRGETAPTLWERLKAKIGLKKPVPLNMKEYLQTRGVWHG